MNESITKGRQTLRQAVRCWLTNDRLRHGAGSKSSATKAQRGMTLVEIMVVVVIIGMVASTVGVAVFNALAQAQNDTARTQMRQVADALDLYKLSNRKYPSSGEGLQALLNPKRGKPTMDSLPEDPWGNAFVYIYPGQHNPNKFDIISHGEDGSPGGGDDLILGKAAE